MLLFAVLMEGKSHLAARPLRHLAELLLQVAGICWHWECCCMINLQQSVDTQNAKAALPYLRSGSLGLLAVVIQTFEWEGVINLFLHFLFKVYFKIYAANLFSCWVCARLHVCVIADMHEQVLPRK